MPFQGDDYTPDSEDDLYQTLLSELESQLANPATNEGDVLNALLKAQAALAHTQEDSLAQLHDAAYIASASGQALELACQDIGVTRNPPIRATGAVEFDHGSPSGQTYTISSGTELTTDGSDSIAFETTETSQIPLLDDFESGSLDADWGGDTGSVSVQSTTTYDGSSYALELPTSSDKTVVHDGTVTLRQGHTIHAFVNVGGSSQVAVQFFRQDASNYYDVFLDDVNGAVKLRETESNTTSVLDSSSVTVPTGVWLHVTIDTDVDGDIDVDVDDTSNSSDVAALAVNDEETFTSGSLAVQTGTANNHTYVDDLTTSKSPANVQAVQGGTETNVGVDTITQFSNRPTGVTAVTNPHPTGDPNFSDTNGTTFVTGKDEEDDEALRDRALSSTSIGGSASVRAIATELRNVTDVASVSFFTNNTSTDNTNSGGLPEWSAEFVVQGGSKDDIGDALHRTVGVTHNLYGGAHGTKESVTVPSSVLAGDTRTYEFSRPSVVNVDLSMDLYVTGDYVGDDAVRDAIVDYIGGVDSDNLDVDGRGVGDDVFIEELRSRIIQVDGVRDIENFSSTPSQTTDANGIEIIDVGGGEVARTDATDGSISMTTTTL